MGTLQIERRKRGIFGWIVAIIFWTFNILTAVWLFGAFKAGSEMPATEAGIAIGIGVAVTVILWTWLFGAIILGIMMFFTRGKRIIETIERP